MNEQLQKMQAGHQDTSQLEGQTSDGGKDHHQTISDSAKPSSTVTLAGTTNESVTLQITHLLYVEAVGNYIKIYHLCDSRVRNDMLRATMKQIEDDLQVYPMIVRCHRAFLVNLGQVEQIVSKSGSMQLFIRYSHESIPVSRSNMAQVKEAIKQTSNGTRRKDNA